MDYESELLLAINNFDENDLDSKNVLRDLVCIISDAKLHEDNLILKELLYVASIKMRTFGYNFANNLKSDPIYETSSTTALQSEAVKTLYRSLTWSNNLLDKTQKDVLDSFNNLLVKRMLVSAPTSFGKTYLMREIVYSNYKRYNNILLVFPTVALINENTEEMKCFIDKKELDYKIFNTINNEIEFDQKNIFVLTPERVIQLLSINKNFTIDFFFFDEVYKIDEDFCYDEVFENEEKSTPNQRKNISVFDSDRAKTFRTVLYILSKTVPEYYLAGPFLNINDFSTGMKKYLETNKILTKEVKFEPTVKITVDAWGKSIAEHSPFELVQRNTSICTTKKEEKICTAIQYIDNNKYGKTLLYCASPSKATTYAKILSNVDTNQKPSFNQDMIDFYNHVKKSYTYKDSANEWSFIKVFEYGYGLHHGKLPRYVQNEVLRMFNEDYINVLFCTSTIIEGVNTKAKNIVLLNTSKGNKRLSSFDIKNIRGRAGRYYHNFVGRVFYIDQRQKRIEESNDMKLDFITYSNRELSTVDLDNAEFEDLSDKNKPNKLKRESHTSNFLLPHEVFIKNRLIQKDAQEVLLRTLLKDDIWFSKFKVLFRFKYLSVKQFFENYILKNILELYCEIGLISTYEYKIWLGASLTYYKLGLNGLLAYEIKSGKAETIDKAYDNMFTKQKNILEYKIPKALTLFESIINCAANLKDLNCSDVTLSKVINFFESGVVTEFGQYLVNYGFPVDTIRKVEKTILQDQDMDKAEVINKHNTQIQGLLDNYERKLLLQAIKEM